MICMLLVVIHLLCIAFGFDGFVRDVDALLLAGLLEIWSVDLLTSLFVVIKKGTF